MLSGCPRPRQSTAQSQASFTYTQFQMHFLDVLLLAKDFWMSFCWQQSHLSGYTRLYPKYSTHLIVKPVTHWGCSLPVLWARSRQTHCHSHAFRLSLSEITKWSTTEQPKLHSSASLCPTHARKESKEVQNRRETTTKKNISSPYLAQQLYD